MGILIVLLFSFQLKKDSNFLIVGIGRSGGLMEGNIFVSPQSNTYLFQER